MNLSVPTANARRSCLVVPGSSMKMLEKARSLDPDQVVFDLEDGVAADAKVSARANVADVLKSGGFEGKVRSVRVNDWTTEWTHTDVLTVVSEAGANLDSMVLAKAESADQVLALDLLLTQAEKSVGLAPGQIRIEVQIESALGLANANAIAASCPRLEGLVFGPADFMASLGMTALEVGEQPPGYDVGDAYHYALMHLLVAARAFGKQAIDGPYLNFKNSTGLAKAAGRTAALGFDGKWAIHPDQIDPINAAFTPDQASYDKAELILDACAYYASSEGGGSGAARLGDEMIDEASRKLALSLAAKGRAAGLIRTQTFHPPER